MNIAITGSNGFLGNHLSIHLRELGHKVRLLQRKNGNDVFQIKNFVNYPKWKLALSEIDVLIHCAAIVHRQGRNNNKKYENYKEINVELTKEIAIQAEKAKVKRIIFISSIKVNGENTKRGMPLNNCSPSNPTDTYSLSKYAAEEDLKLLSQKGNIEVVIIRPPLIYGPNVKANFLNLIKIINLGVPLPFFNVDNKRSFIYVGNLVSFIASCIEKETAANKTFLVSDPFPISTPLLIKMISSALNRKTRVFKFPIFLLKVFGYLTNTKEKINRLIDDLEIDPLFSFKTLEWKPPYSTEEGIKKTIDWFKESQT